MKNSKGAAVAVFIYVHVLCVFMVKFFCCAMHKL